MIQLAEIKFVGQYPSSLFTDFIHKTANVLYFLLGPITKRDMTWQTKNLHEMMLLSCSWPFLHYDTILEYKSKQDHGSVPGYEK